MIFLWGSLATASPSGLENPHADPHSCSHSYKDTFSIYSHPSRECRQSLRLASPKSLCDISDLPAPHPYILPPCPLCQLWLKPMGATEEQWELISALPDWAALQSCLFIQNSRPLRKWLCLFPSVSCERGLNIPTPPPPSTRPGTARPILLMLSCKSNPQNPRSLASLHPHPQEKALLKVEMKVVQARNAYVGTGQVRALFSMAP